MAIRAKNQGQEQVQEQAQAQNPFEQGNTQAPPSPLPMGALGIMSPLASRGTGGESFEELFTKVEETVKYLNETVKDGAKFYALKLLKRTVGVRYSSIIVVEEKKGSVSAHILMVEKTGEYPEKNIQTVGGVTYEIIRTPAEALDEKYVLAVQALVADSLNVDMKKVVVVDGTLVPNEFDTKSESAAEGLINNAVNAVIAENEIRVHDYKGFSIPELLNTYRNGSFSVSMHFNNDDVDYFDAAGMPVRQDVCVSLSFRTNIGNRDSRSINFGDSSIDIVKVYGYVDFEHIKPPMNSTVMLSQKFAPNFVITSIVSERAPSPDILMLGVASVLSLNSDMNWLQAFKSKVVGKGEIDYNDIGALNIEANLNGPIGSFGKKLDTKKKDFTVPQLLNFVNLVVEPNLMVSIDVPKAGPETWYESIFRYIKFNNDPGALGRVEDALGTLTNGAYAKGSSPLFVPHSNKFHGGAYRTKNGTYKDIRHLSSYLSVANYLSETGQQLDLLIQYNNTLYMQSMPDDLRAAERAKFLDEMSNGTAIYKQYHDRLTFTGAFLANLASSLRHVGFAPVPTNMGSGMGDVFSRRPTVDFSSALISPDVNILGSTNTFTGSYLNPGYQRNY